MPDTNKQTRMPGKQRRLEIVRVAAELFATNGFSVPTRKISEVLGITQAALYKHFKSKNEIIEEVFRVRYLDEKPSDFSTLLEESDGPLEDRLTLAYVSFFKGLSEISMKLFHRASYDGLEIAKRYSPHLDQRIIWPVLENLRAEAGLPPLAQLPAISAERELVLMMHSTVVFLGIRKFVYQIDFKGNEPKLIHQYVNVWVTGALANLDSYHEQVNDSDAETC